MSNGTSESSTLHLTYSTLGDRERIWAHYQPFLEERGYMLRPRYRPGWVSEALTTGKDIYKCEDSISSEDEVLDATRISDGAQVVLKIVEMKSTEISISMYLTSEPGTEKHTIPILELIPIWDEPEWAFMATPRMRMCTDPPFFIVACDFADFVRQVLEGLVFMHSKNIAHRDICTANMVVDASRMPGGFHFISPCSSDDINFLQYGNPEVIPHAMITRNEAGPMDYYYIDFGLSVQFPSFEARKLVTGACGRLRKHIPEISATVPYDPFKADVRLVGEMLWREFLVYYTGLDFIEPLLEKLCNDNPAQRPDAVRALAFFNCLVSNMSEEELAGPIGNGKL
ncbi:hypothetical protein DFH09DRAFT_1046202 [Mycena vulgaris]|nr:hypothetical protein DFH09DRAFT_1046202 [Mycena vulgaris]